MATTEIISFPTLYVRPALSTHQIFRSYSLVPMSGYRPVQNVEDLPHALMEVLLFDTPGEAYAYLVGAIDAGAENKLDYSIHDFHGYTAILAIWLNADPEGDTLDERIRVVDLRHGASKRIVSLNAD